MTSAAGVRYVIGKLRLSRFQQCTVLFIVRWVLSRKSSPILKEKANVQYVGEGAIHTVTISYLFSLLL